MPLKLRNTMSRSIETFEPLQPGRVLVYGCGPTVYDHAHIGNFRSFLFYDLVHRYLEWSGYEVRFVVNLTDVDDRTIRGAVAEGVSIAAHTRRYAELFLADSNALGIQPADAYPKATEYVDRMVAFIRRLLDSGHAYVAEDGAVYFSIARFPGYGRLKGIDLSTLRAGARVAQDEYEKEDARDFALWKAATEEDERAGAAWEAPWGRGRPGWHLECSVMSTTELAETIDLHLGGEDLVFPHHENEIAQSEAATGKPFVRYWLHVKHLLVEGKKMSKSLGNFFTVRQLVDQGFDPASIRHQLIGAQYRKELNFTLEGLEASRNAVQRLVDFESRLQALATSADSPPTGLPSLAEELLDEFRTAMDDDFNSADALAALFTFVNRVNGELDANASVREADRDAAARALSSVDSVLGLLEVARVSRAIGKELATHVQERIRERTEAKRNRDFATADAIRDELAEQGIVLEDGPDGTRWKVVR